LGECIVLAQSLHGFIVIQKGAATLSNKSYDDRVCRHADSAINESQENGT
jgi:hypothetical protein